MPLCVFLLERHEHIKILKSSCQMSSNSAFTRSLAQQNPTHSVALPREPPTNISIFFKSLASSALGACGGLWGPVGAGGGSGGNSGPSWLLIALIGAAHRPSAPRRAPIGWGRRIRRCSPLIEAQGGEKVINLQLKHSDRQRQDPRKANDFDLFGCKNTRSCTDDAVTPVCCSVCAFSP